MTTNVNNTLGREQYACAECRIFHQAIVIPQNSGKPPKRYVACPWDSEPLDPSRFRIGLPSVADGLRSRVSA